MLLDARDYEIFADYHQFVLQDEDAELDISQPLWDGTSVKDMLFVNSGMVHIGTERNMTVPVRLEIHDVDPYYSEDDWDHVTESSLEIRSGRIVIMGCTDYFPTADRIPIHPGMYRVRAYYGALDSLSFDGLDGDDHYRVVLWPAPSVTPCVLKRKQTTQ